MPDRKNENITAEMTIAKILKCRPGAAKIFMRYGMYCIGCSIGESESLQAAAEMHDVNIEDILFDLNKSQES